AALESCEVTTAEASSYSSVGFLFIIQLWIGNVFPRAFISGKYDEAEPMYVRAIAIGEKALGPEHP
ncbi:unnamed protein product, partial [Ectocarpus sp. 12 AP-2014]